VSDGLRVVGMEVPTSLISKSRMYIRYDGLSVGDLVGLAGYGALCLMSADSGD
jgi:hypothetical protein